MSEPEPESIESFQRRKDAAKEWITATFTDWYSIFPERVGPKTPLYSATFCGTLYLLVLDGYTPARPNWAQGRPESPSTVLLSALSTLVQRRSAFWALLNCHDGAYWEVFNIWPAYPSYIAHAFGELQSHPADEGGPSCLVLLFDDRESIVTFEHTFESEAPYLPRFEIAFFGSDKHRDELLALLNGSSESAQ